MIIKTQEKREVERKTYLYLTMKTNRFGIVFYTIGKEFQDGEQIEIEQLYEETVARAIFNEIIKPNSKTKSIQEIRYFFMQLRRQYGTSNTTEAARRYLIDMKLYLH